MNSRQIRKMIMAAMCIAIGVVLPMAFHGIPNAGKVFLPMHIPVLICGLACGWQYGFLCGIVTPFLSSSITGMPPMGVVPKMVCELAVYGLVAGLLLKVVHTKRYYVNMYLSLLVAMILGRIVMGVLNAFVFSAGSYSIKMWITGAFITALPGIVIQLAFIPTVCYGLEKMRVIERRV